MSEEVLIQLSEPITEAQYDQFILFRMRFQELWNNWTSLKALGLKLGGSFQNKGNGVVSGPGCGVEHHRLKGFYLDFRFFHAQKEPTHYFKVAKLLSKHCNDERLRDALAEDRETWITAGMLSDWHGITPDDLINSLFNGRYFHNATDMRPALEQISRSMTDDLANHELTYCIHRRMLMLRNFNWYIAPLTFENQLVRAPKPQL